MCFPDIGTVRLQCVLTDFQISARCVVQILAGRMDPCKTFMFRDLRVFVSNMGMDLGVTGKCVRIDAVGEVIDVLRPDDVNFGETNGRLSMRRL